MCSKKRFLLFILTLVVMALPLRAEGIAFFHGTWQETLAKAKSENKLVFVDFYTQWCGPCLNMAQTVFVLPEVGAFYNANFVSAKIDTENGEGIELAKKYGVRSFPTYVFIDPATGEAVHRSSSRQTEEQFIATGKAALTPTQRSFYLIEEYNKGNREPQLLNDYIRYNHSIYQRKAVEEAFDALIAGGAKLTDQNIWDLFVDVIGGMDNKYVQQVSKEYSLFCQTFGKKAVDAKLVKETMYGDVALLDSMCDFEGKAFNRKMIEVSKLVYSKQYDKAAVELDALIADPTVDQQELIQRMKFLVRVPRGYKSVPATWFYKSVEYLRYIAYNQTDRDDANIHQEYAAALEELLRNLPDKTQVPAVLLTAPKYGKKGYSMRPDVLKPKPKH
jgi:thiol-disulfide isomerase/thioredoxin